MRYRKKFSRAQQIAAATNRSVEAVLIDGLALLFGGLPETVIDLDDLRRYSDEQLWAVVHSRLAWPQETRLRELVDSGKRGLLSDDEKAEIERLIDLVDRAMLLLLKQRGREVEKQLKLGA